MSGFIATIRIYDLMGTVSVGGVVREIDPLSDAAPETVLSASVQVSGIGETDAARWLRDALVALAETL